jgi:hypothetical protein
MPAHLVAARRQIANGQGAQALKQTTRLDAKRRAKMVKAENICAPSAGFKPISDLDEVRVAFPVFRVHAAEVASNRVF